MLNYFKYNFLVHETISIKDLLNKWLIPRKIRGYLRINKKILINGLNRATSFLLHDGDQISFEIPDNQKMYLAKKGEINIVFENEDYILINKLAGQKMHAHSPNEDDTILNFAQYYFDTNKIMSRNHPAIALITHRIDRETSGIVVVAKNPLAKSIINQLLSKKIIKRAYLAWVSGTLIEEKGIIKSKIGIDPKNPYKRIIDLTSGQEAVTKWYKMHTVYQNTLLRLELETGRTHQIRIHLKSIGHPIVGDYLYNDEGINYSRLLLHSATIQIPNLFSDYSLLKSFSAQIPSDFPRNLRK
ncbi:MAG: RluA family pseudouridine synthase [Lactobacillaceae bacterium]|jgi:23S rRNA pseudouridine1911/1915/1917 synthase|nr:RluA family pseudouridine synthase [Lactobacillaceae bacterium]